MLGILADGCPIQNGHIARNHIALVWAFAKPKYVSVDGSYGCGEIACVGLSLTLYFLAMLPETWTLLSRDSKETVVSRNQNGRLTIWTLQDRGKGWRVYAIRFSSQNAGCNRVLERTKTYDGQCRDDYKGACWDGSAHPNGIRLTVNRIDSILREYCEGHRA